MVPALPLGAASKSLHQGPPGARRTSDPQSAAHALLLLTFPPQPRPWALPRPPPLQSPTPADWRPSQARSRPEAPTSPLPSSARQPGSSSPALSLRITQLCQVSPSNSDSGVSQLGTGRGIPFLKGRWRCFSGGLVGGALRWLQGRPDTAANPPHSVQDIPPPPHTLSCTCPQAFAGPNQPASPS